MAQRQDQVKAGKGKDRNADQHPQGMIAVGLIDAVERTAVTFTDILSDLEVIICIIAREPAP